MTSEDPLAVALTAAELAGMVADAVRDAIPARAEIPGFLSPRQAADALGVSESTVRNWVKAGEIDAARKGSKWLIPIRALDRITETARMEAAARRRTQLNRSTAT